MSKRQDNFFDFLDEMIFYWINKSPSDASCRERMESLIGSILVGMDGASGSYTPPTGTLRIIDGKGKEVIDGGKMYHNRWYDYLRKKNGKT